MSLNNNKILKCIGRIGFLFLIGFIVSLYYTGIAVGVGSDSDKSRTIKVGVDSHLPPFSYIESDGAIKGINIDILRAIAIAAGLDIELYAQPRNELIQNLLNDSIDSIVGTDDEMEQYTSLGISKPFIEGKEAIFETCK